MNILKLTLLNPPRSQTSFGNVLVCAILLLGFLPSLAPATDTPGVSPSATADPLTEALPILQAKYPDFQALNYKPSDHLSDLIARSNGGISLSAPETVAAPVPIVTATLPNDIIYWRLASLTPKTNWSDLARELEVESTRTPYGGAILDLRGNTEKEDVWGAIQIINFFEPGDKYLVNFCPFIAEGNRRRFIGFGISDHPLRGALIVLVNNQTSGLKADGALVMGRKTAGKAAVFEERRLTSGQILSYAEANVSLADGIPLWGHPVVPDIDLTVDDHTEKAALTLIRDNHILDVIEESPERRRMSEASLVEGQDPEWDDYLASLERKPVLLSLPVIHDAVLIRALDSLKAIHFSQRPLPAQATADASLPAPSSIQ
jgi:hypothetical protein